MLEGGGQGGAAAEVSMTPVQAPPERDCVFEASGGCGGNSLCWVTWQRLWMLGIRRVVPAANKKRLAHATHETSPSNQPQVCICTSPCTPAGLAPGTNLSVVLRAVTGASISSFVPWKPGTFLKGTTQKLQIRGPGKAGGGGMAAVTVPALAGMHPHPPPLPVKSGCTLLSS